MAFASKAQLREAASKDYNGASGRMTSGGTPELDKMKNAPSKLVGKTETGSGSRKVIGTIATGSGNAGLTGRLKGTSYPTAPVRGKGTGAVK